MDCYLDGLVYRTNDHKKLTQASLYFKKPIQIPIRIIEFTEFKRLSFKKFIINIEPKWMLDWRRKAFNRLLALKEPNWQKP